MIECRGCGRRIDISSPYCPHCGKPCGMRTYTSAPAAAARSRSQNDRPMIKVALIAAIGLFSIVLWQLVSRVNDASQNPAEQQSAQSTAVTR